MGYERIKKFNRISSYRNHIPNQKRLYKQNREIFSTKTIGGNENDVKQTHN